MGENGKGADAAAPLNAGDLDSLAVEQLKKSLLVIGGGQQLALLRTPEQLPGHTVQ
ncbi:hypothetical protein D3C75_1344910 [compost metagenome]